MEKITLQNRKGQNIVGVLTKPDEEIKGTCVVQHGWSGKKEEAHIIAMQNAFLKNGFQTFNFDPLTHLMRVMVSTHNHDLGYIMKILRMW